MHIHLDPIGGLAGDMFAAAMLDYNRDWQTPLYEAIGGSGLTPDLEVCALQHNDGSLTGHRFEVKQPTRLARHHHRRWRDIRERLHDSGLETAVKERAIAIFELLAEAEAEVHGSSLSRSSGTSVLWLWLSVAEWTA